VSAESRCQSTGTEELRSSPVAVLYSRTGGCAISLRLLSLLNVCSGSRVFARCSIRPGTLMAATYRKCPLSHCILTSRCSNTKSPRAAYPRAWRKRNKTTASQRDLFQSYNPLFEWTQKMVACNPHNTVQTKTLTGYSVFLHSDSVALLHLPRWLVSHFPSSVLLNVRFRLPRGGKV
jgi:hypothetical protein